MFGYRIRRLKPREVRSIRHWAIELAVVVVGVLLALWSAQWAEDRREAKVHAAALDNVDVAIEDAINTFAHYAVTKPCVEAQRDVLLSQLREPGDQWRGVGAANEQVGLSSDVAFPYPFTPLGMTFNTAAFDRARSAGAFESLNRERADIYAAVETQLGFAKVFAQVFLDSYSTFAPLSADRALSQDMRIRLEQELARADLALDSMEYAGLVIRRDLRSIGWTMSDEARAKAEREVKSRLKQYGKCAADVDPFPRTEDTTKR